MFDVKEDNPSLCGYCKQPAKGYLYIDNKKHYGACSMSHLSKIAKGEKLPRIARLSEKGLRYAITQTRDTYIEISKEEKTYIMHEWDKKNRERLFSSIILNYLDFANYQAETGLSDFGESS